MNRERLVRHLLDLVKIDSESRHEKEIALRLKRELEDLGAQVMIDDAGEKAGGNVGNLIAFVKGSVEAPSLLLCAHMDTVMPGNGVKPVVEGTIIRSDGSTVLGGDDKSGIAVMMEVLRTLKEEKIPHSDLECVFTICEEAGLLGARYLDTTKLRSKYGLVLDSDDVAYLFTKAPCANKMEFKIHGLEAHAGVCPEQGISAIKVAGEAIASMRLGRIDEETTANVGIIQGGVATNIVPNLVTLKAEARSHNEEKLERQTAHMKECLKQAAERYRATVEGKEFRASVEEEISRDYDRMDVADDAPIVKLVVEAARNLGQQVETRATGGGCDANIFNRRGIQVANLGTGMQAIHTVKEWLNTDELFLSAQVVLEIVKLNAQVKVSGNPSAARSTPRS